MICHLINSLKNIYTKSGVFFNAYIKFQKKMLINQESLEIKYVFGLRVR